MSKPLISVVVPSFNSEKFVEETLLSVEQSMHPNVEYIFIDGGSTDRTMVIVERYAHLFAHVISEPDKGQSDAFNKGFKLAQGEYLTWLNSDDVFCADAIDRIVDYIHKTRKLWYAANMLYINSDSEVLRCCKSGSFERWAMSFGILNVFGPSTILHRDLFTRFGDFNEDFHYCMDTEYWWRIASAGITYSRAPIYLWALRLHDDAKTASAITGEFNKRPKGMQEEGALLMKKYYPKRTNFRFKLGIFLVRLHRLLNGSYCVGIFDSFKHKGKNVFSV